MDAARFEHRPMDFRVGWRLTTIAKLGAIALERPRWCTQYAYGASVELSIMPPDARSHHVPLTTERVVRTGIELAGRVGLGALTRRRLYEHALTYDCDCDIQLESGFDLVLDGLERLRNR